MNRLTFKKYVTWVVLFLAAYAFIGIYFVIFTPQSDWFGLYKSLVPLIVAVPSAVLAGAFQRRVSYVNALRDLWKQLVPAIQEAIQYTYLAKPSQSQFAAVQIHLSTVIDALRGVFKNIGESNDSNGLFPYEGIKDIQKIISGLKFDDDFENDFSAKNARNCIVKLWKEMHQALLAEFDREEPVNPISRYLIPDERSIVDELFHPTPSSQYLEESKTNEKVDSQD